MGTTKAALEQLVETLYTRSRKIRDLITAFHESRGNPFPDWHQPATTASSNLMVALQS